MAAFTIVGFSVLRAVVEAGSFTGAATALGYTQSAVSRQIAAMESAAGAPLFERTQRGVLLTDAGRRVLTHAIGVLEHVDALRGEMAVPGAPATRLRVGAFPTAWAALAPRALVSFLAEHPDAKVKLREGATPVQLRRVRGGSSDLAVFGVLAGAQLDLSGLAVTPLLDDPLLLAVARTHPLAARRAVAVEELAGERWIIGSTEPADAFLGALPSVPDPRVAFVAREWTTKLGLVAAGLGVALVPGIAASSVRGDVALVRVRGDASATRSVAVAIAAQREPVPAVAAFVRELTGAADAVGIEIRRRVDSR